MTKPAESVAATEITAENASEIALKEIQAEEALEKSSAEVVPGENLPTEDKPAPSKDEPPAKSDESVVKTDEEILAAEDKDLSDPEKEKKKALTEAIEADEKQLLEKPEADLSADEKEKRATVVLKREAKEAEALETSIKTYAEKKQIPVEDARKIFEHTAKIQEKYGKDPFELSKAVLENQHLIARKDEEIKAIKEHANRPKQPETVGEWENVLKTRGIVMAGGKVLPWEEGVEIYRRENAELVDGLGDEQVLKHIAKDIHTRFDLHRKEQIAIQIRQATDRRAELVKTIPEKDKVFAKEVADLLDTVPDGLILEKDYDISNALRWARGNYFTHEKVEAMVKEAELKGFNRGKIAASGKIVSGPIGQGKVPSGKTVVSLSPAQKNEALDMFPDAKDEKEAFESYVDVMKEKNKK